jgi:hypothetical protein
MNNDNRDGDFGAMLSLVKVYYIIGQSGNTILLQGAPYVQRE